MQVTRRFEGSRTPGEEVERRLIWGVDDKVNVRPNRIEFINKSIATFLSEDCGVNAAWEARPANGDDENEPWLYIENVPFLFAAYTYGVRVRVPIGRNEYGGYYYGWKNYTRSAAGMYHPLVNPKKEIFKVDFTLYETETDGELEIDNFKFDLVFFGGAKTGWCLRFKPYDSTAIQSVHLCFYNATQLCTGNPGAIITGAAKTIQTGVRGTGGGAKLATTVEINNTTKEVIKESAYRKTANDNDTATFLAVKSGGNGAFWHSCNQKLPLIPITCGLFQAKGCYQHIPGMRIPDARKSTEEAQTQFDTGGHTFINTCPEKDDSGYISMGLIDAT